MFEVAVSNNDPDVWLSIKEGLYTPVAGQTANQEAETTMSVGTYILDRRIELLLLWVENN